jgi:glycosyltransferase involved in cell wall biosynthesis
MEKRAEKIDVTILLPTFNEADNVMPLIRALDAALDGVKYSTEILFVDDSSDDTPKRITKAMRLYPNVRMLHRPKAKRNGLAMAFVDGFQEAKGNYILCMDSDLQHPPEVAPELIRTIVSSKKDIVVASRYLPGGGADGLGTLYRKFASHVCRVLAWIFLPQTRKTTDPGSGFFIMQRDLVKDVSFGGLRGFKILIDVLSRTPWSQVDEVPYVFRKRENETSKATLEQGYQYILHLLHLRKQTIELVREERRQEREYLNRSLAKKKSPETMSGRLDLYDIPIITGIIAVGWLLVGYFTGYPFIYTGYEDWIYHAFRAQSLEQYGMPSWNHVWANGMNIWRLYQYLQHHLILGIASVTGLPITTVLIYLMVGVFVGLRIAVYASLRLLGVNRIFAAIAVLLSYTMVQEWGSMQDYSIYLSFAVLPLYVLLWIRSFDNLALASILTAITGAIWTVHPVLGFSLSILLGFFVLFSPIKNDSRKLFMLAVIYLVSATPFLAQYFTSGYLFTNPIFKSSIYLSLSLIPVSGGLSFLYWTVFVVSWLLLIIRSDRIAPWVKALFSFSSFYLLLISLGQNGFLPGFLSQFQFSRGLPIIGFTLVYSFAAIFSQTLGNIRSRSAMAMAVGFMAISISGAINTASGFYVPPVVNAIENPVAVYFKDRALPTGSVYYDNVSEASYFAPQGVRFATSYNEHAQPHPYSTRLRMLMRQSVAYTGVSENHIRTVENYAAVLGIEYLFLPTTSPLVSGLTEKENPYFERLEEIESVHLLDTVTVLRYVGPIRYAYVFDRRDIPEELFSGDILLPTLHASTYQRWDVPIGTMADLLRSDKGIPLPLSFVGPDGLDVDISSYRDLSGFEQPVLLIMQSFDDAWSIEGGESVGISPTPLRFMRIDLSEIPEERSSVSLRNSWPWWHWPAQSVGLVMVGATSAAYYFSRKRKVQ